MAAEAVVTLRHGLRRAGTCHRDAVIHGLTGAHEAWLAELGPGENPAARATAIIAAALRSIGTIAPVTLADARALTAGDRERLLLHIYSHTFGRPFEAVVDCPAAGCGETMEFAFAVDDVLEAPPAAPADPAPDDDAWTLDAGVGEARLTVRYRLPDGADQEAAARIARRDPAAAADSVLKRCVLGITDGAGRPVAPEPVLADLRAPLAAAFAKLDPEAETELRAPCPACGTEVTALLDAESFLAGEFARTDGIFGEVDRLARTYHWSEAEILALTVARRRRYLALAGTMS